MKSLKASTEFKVGKHKIGWLDSDFTSRYGKETFQPSKRTLSSHTLKRSMLDSEIIGEFDSKECTLGDVLHFLDTADEAFKDGNWNIFYVGAFVVHVSWYSFDSTWYVVAWKRGVGRWNAGRRVFSPATGSSSTSSSALGSSDALPSILTINGVRYKRV